MENESKHKLLFAQIDQCLDIPEKFKESIRNFLMGYYQAASKGGATSDTLLQLFNTLFRLLREQAQHPYTFEPYHQGIRAPFDYYNFGLDFLRPLVDLPNSSLSGKAEITKIAEYLQKKDNVILLSNHQTEADPQAISLILEANHFHDVSQEIICVAGERVITDPLAVPFSMGINLLCIYSKRYIDHPPELKHKKQLHNKRTMEQMSELLRVGGKCIWVAPSGGRDRLNPQGEVEVAPFDPQSIEMFYLMAQKSGHPTHFFPLALDTYHLLPPPNSIQIELGEARLTNRGPIHLAFGTEIDMRTFPGHDHDDRHERRKLRAQHIHDSVKKMYTHFKH